MSNKEIFEQIQSLRSRLNIHNEISEGMDSPFVEQMTTQYESQINDFQNMLKTARTPLPVCPHCGWEELDVAQVIWNDKTDITCDGCGAEYKCTPDFNDKSYTTKKA